MIHKMRMAAVAVFMVLAFAGIMAAATQTVDPPAVAEPVSWAQIAAILATGLFGIPVKGLTQIIKEAMRKYLKFPDAHWTGWLAAAIAVVPAAFLYLKPLGQFSWPNLAIASLIGWAVANGWYRGEVAIEEKNEQAMEEMAMRISISVSRINVGLLEIGRASNPPPGFIARKPI